jgi:hypothetical protein
VGRGLPTLAQWLVLAARLVWGTAYHALGLLNHDASYLLDSTERWLIGARPLTECMIER